ncbi:recombinase family protein [Nocardia nova]|uniref:recombinase family protein n=1 Tax=Nocardia nova TaxID=37330 RepID=UPI0037B7D2ED
MRILRAIIYARVSNDDGKTGRSCREQIDACTSDCGYEGWQIGEVLEDNDRGASRHSKRERVNYQRLPDVLRAGDVLVVWEPSRITRNMVEFAEFCDMCADRGVVLYYDGRLWDLNDDDDRNRVWQDILDGAKQAGKTRKRVLRAMAANVEGGKPHGKRAPGYRIVRDESGRSIGREVEPGQQKVLQMAARAVLEQGASVSLRQLSRELAADWAAAGGVGKFDGRDIRRFLTSPTTFGYRVHDGKIVGQGTWEPVLDPDIYQQLCAILLDPNRLSHRGSEPRWLLSYIAQCGVCLEAGEPGIMDHKGPNKPRGSDSYVCRAKNHVARNMRRLDEHVEELLMRLLERPDVAASLVAREESDTVAIDDQVAEIEQLRRELATFVRDAAKTRMSAQAVAVYVEEMETQIREAQGRLDALTNQLDPLTADSIGPDARERWKGRTMLQKRDLIRRHLSVVVLPVEKRGRFAELGVKVRPLRSLV